MRSTQLKSGNILGLQGTGINNYNRVVALLEIHIITTVGFLFLFPCMHSQAKIKKHTLHIINIQVVTYLYQI